MPHHNALAYCWVTSCGALSELPDFLISAIGCLSALPLHLPWTPYRESVLSVNIWHLLTMTHFFLFTLIKDTQTSFKPQVGMRSPTVSEDTGS